MKNILLTTTALVAFAGAAAADGHTSVSFAGEASVEYNSEAGGTFTTAAELTATGSATLDNGLTASTSITVDGVAGTVSAGDITLSSDTVAVTFGTGMNGAAFAAVGDEYAAQTGQDVEEKVDGMTATVTVGAATVYVSAPNLANIDTAELEFGVSAAVGDMTIAAATANSNFAVVGSVTVSGATLGFGMATDSVWDASISYPMGALTLSASTDEASAWIVGGSYAVSDALTAGIEYKSNAADDDTYEVTAAYAAGDAVFNAAFDGTDFSLSAGYTMGAIYAEAGISYASETYVEATYDLGGGAAAYASYAQKKDQNIAEDLAVGTTVGLSFAF